jgi:hypothetical protein
MKHDWKNWTVTSTYTGSKAAPWSDGRENWNHHNVTVINRDNGKRTRFDFWASIAHPEIDTEYDLMNAFRCFVDDALAGSMEFREFCADFGYDEDSRRAEKIWNACKRSTAKLTRIYDGDLYDLLNEMEEYA